VQFDPEAILRVVAQHRVEYVLVGGLGASLYGSPILTDDVDIVPDLKKTNLDALAAALNELNARSRSHEELDGIEIDWSGKNLQKWIVDFQFLNLLTDYGVLDLLHRPGGTAGYRELARNAEQFEVGDFVVHAAALEDIIRSKEAVGRERDLQHLPTLRLLLERRRDR